LVAQKAGGVAGGIAGTGFTKVKGAGQWGVNKAKSVGQNTGKFAGRMGLAGVGAGLLRVGVGARDGTVGASVNKIGQFSSQWSKDMSKTREKQKAVARQKVLEKLGMSADVGGGVEKLRAVVDDKNVKIATNFAKGAGYATTGLAFGAPSAVAAMALGAYGARGGIGSFLTSVGKNNGKAEKRNNELRLLESQRATDFATASTKRKSALSALGERPSDGAGRKKYDQEEKKINKEYDNDRSTAKDKFSKAKEVLDKKNPHSILGWREGLGAVGGTIKGPNHYVVEGAKLATQENVKVHKTVDELATSGAHEVDKNAYYSPGGPNSSQQKLFDALNSGTEAASKALKNMADSLRSNSSSLNTAQKSNVQALKQLVAAQKSAGKDISAWGDVISVLNNIDTDDPNRKSVDDYVKKA